MVLRNPVLRHAFHSGAGRHERCRSGERQRLSSALDDEINDYFEDQYPDNYQTLSKEEKEPQSGALKESHSDSTTKAADQ